jgi:hypothetical protein
LVLCNSDIITFQKELTASSTPASEEVFCCPPVSLGEIHSNIALPRTLFIYKAFRPKLRIHCLPIMRASYLAHLMLLELTVIIIIIIIIVIIIGKGYDWGGERCAQGVRGEARGKEAIGETQT